MKTSWYRNVFLDFWPFVRVIHKWHEAFMFALLLNLTNCWTDKLSLIWDAMALMWRHFNGNWSGIVESFSRLVLQQKHLFLLICDACQSMFFFAKLDIYIRLPHCQFKNKTKQRTGVCCRFIPRDPVRLDRRACKISVAIMTNLIIFFFTLCSTPSVLMA